MGYTQDLVAHWDLSADNPPDICWRGNRYPGTGANIVGHPDGIAGGKCTEFNGNNSNVNVGDVVEMNSVEKFTMAFWMNVNVIPIDDIFFSKQLDTSNRILILNRLAGATFEVFVCNSGNVFGTFVTATFLSVNTWHHIAIVFDGSQAANTTRLVVYVDGVPITLTFTGTIPATTADLSAVDAFIGRATNALDGKLDEFVILSAALTQIQVNDLMIRQRQGRF